VVNVFDVGRMALLILFFPYLFPFQLSGSQKFVLGNIHVLFSPKRGDIKLGQVYVQLKSTSFVSCVSHIIYNSLVMTRCSA
jgi:hypothetical protein